MTSRWYAIGLGLFLILFSIYYWYNLPNWFPDLFRTYGTTGHMFEAMLSMILTMVGLCILIMGVGCLYSVVVNYEPKKKNKER